MARSSPNQPADTKIDISIAKKISSSMKNSRHITSLKKGDTVIFKNESKRYKLSAESVENKFTINKSYTLEQEAKIKLIPDNILYFLCVKDDNNVETYVRSECFDW